MREPEAAHDWLSLTAEELSPGAAYAWAIRPDCGAVALFGGTVRNHADGRTGVTALTYEAYEEHVQARLARVAGEIRRRWPMVGRIVLWHRIGELALGETSVVVAVSSPHRPEAFDAARFGIDALKATAPIWKKESWEGSSEGATGAPGDAESWALGAQDITEAGEVASVASPGRDQGH